MLLNIVILVSFQVSTLFTWFPYKKYLYSSDPLFISIIAITFKMEIIRILQHSDNWRRPTVTDNYRMASLELLPCALPIVNYNVVWCLQVVPGCEGEVFSSSRYWGCYIQHMASSFWHPAGTCKMGPSSDPLAVTDHRLRSAYCLFHPVNWHFPAVMEAGCLPHTPVTGHSSFPLSYTVLHSAVLSRL